MDNFYYENYRDAFRGLRLSVVLMVLMPPVVWILFVFGYSIPLYDRFDSHMSDVLHPEYKWFLAFAIAFIMSDITRGVTRYTKVVRATMKERPERNLATLHRNAFLAEQKK